AAVEYIGCGKRRAGHHDFFFAADDTDRKTAANHLTQGRNIGFNSVNGLSSADSHPESGLYFIKNKQNIELLRQLPQSLHEALLGGDKTGLNRLHHDSSELVLS